MYYNIGVKYESHKSNERMLMKIEHMKMIVNAAYGWRAAEIHAAACFLGIRKSDIELADEIELKKLTQLRILLDTLKKV